MSEYKKTKWACSIIEKQHDDGSWGFFHSLGYPSEENSITTEQALRRLQVLGFTIDDEPVKKAVSYMRDCLRRTKQIPDRREKVHNWDIFTDLMLSAWIRRFTKADEEANRTGEKWCRIISSAFSTGVYNHSTYVKTYKEVHNLPPKGGRLLDIANFYHVSLMQNMLNTIEAQAMVEYLINHETGIYYVYDKRLLNTPLSFKSLNACRYVSAIELLSDYDKAECREKLSFAVKWLNNNKEKDGLWDMSSEAKDGINFPLSDSWRSKDDRITDCTYRIENLIRKLQ